VWLLHHRHDGPELAAGITLRGCRGTATIHERDMTVIRIISGGQTGADHAVLHLSLARRLLRLDEPTDLVRCVLGRRLFLLDDFAMNESISEIKR